MLEFNDPPEPINPNDPSTFNARALSAFGALDSFVQAVNGAGGLLTSSDIVFGSNANGDFVYLPGGVLICGTSIQGAASGPLTRFWPAEFATLPRVSASIAGIGPAFVTIANNSETSIDVYTFNASGAQITGFAGLIAFGQAA